MATADGHGDVESKMEILSLAPTPGSAPEEPALHTSLPTEAASWQHADNGAAPHQTQQATTVIDPAIFQALTDKERPTVLRLESMIEAFLMDTSRDVLEFPRNLSNYQRMLAHRVGQHFGLQTSTVDYETTFGRVVGSRTKWSTMRDPKLSQLELSPSKPGPLTDRPTGSSKLNGGDPSERVSCEPSCTTSASNPKLLRRPDGSLRNANASLDSQKAPRCIKEREEEYSLARDRILGNAGSPAAAQSGRGMGTNMGRGSEGSGSSGRGGHAGSSARGGGRRAVMRDCDKEEMDPDYMRGANRYAPTAALVPPYQGMAPQGGIYQMPPYGSEFQFCSLNQGVPHMYAPQVTGYHMDPPFSPQAPHLGFPSHQQQPWQAPQQSFCPPPPPPPPNPSSPSAGRGVSQVRSLGHPPAGAPQAPPQQMLLNQHIASPLTRVPLPARPMGGPMQQTGPPAGYPLPGYLHSMIPGNPMPPHMVVSPGPFPHYRGVPVPNGALPYGFMPPPGEVPGQEGGAVSMASPQHGMPMGMSQPSPYTVYMPAGGMPPQMYHAHTQGAAHGAHGTHGPAHGVAHGSGTRGAAHGTHA